MARETILSPPKGSRALVFMHPAALNQTGAIQPLKNAKAKKGQNWSRFKSMAGFLGGSPYFLASPFNKGQGKDSKKQHQPPRRSKLRLKGPARNREMGAGGGRISRFFSPSKIRAAGGKPPIGAEGWKCGPLPVSQPSRDVGRRKSKSLERPNKAPLSPPRGGGIPERPSPSRTSA
uniref:Uncharacterized protein n=1 Tax=Micrurus corallinus TaxID=54390 RepID=A0A2D4FC10_MICCO